MTDTPALLPPDPTEDAHYWIKHVEFGAIPVRWDTAGQFWENGFDASHMGRLGCTLASPHPIPSAAGLGRLYVLVQGFEAEGAAKEQAGDTISVGAAAAFFTAAAMLRTALEDKS